MLMRTVLVAFCVALVCGFAAAQSVVLEFDAPVPGTLADANGNGTGFTDRFPGTGIGVPTNDPSVTLGAGHLTIASQPFTASPIPGPMPSAFTVPCLVRDTSLGQDFAVTLRLRDNHQTNNTFTAIVVGTSSSQYIYYVTSDNGYTGMQATWVPNWVTHTPGPVVAPGEDLELTLTRSNGSWLGQWKVLNTGVSGTTGLELPGAFQNEPSLYIGIASGHPVWSPPHIDTVDAFSISFGGLPQANSTDARLEINGVGAGTSPGPFAVSLASGSQFTLTWGGPPHAAIALFAGPMTPLTLNFGCVGSVGIGTPGLFYSDVSVVIDGTAPGLPSVIYHLGPTGTASQTFGWVAPPGFRIGLQGLLFQPLTSPCGLVLTAAFGVTTTM